MMKNIPKNHKVFLIFFIFGFLKFIELQNFTTTKTMVLKSIDSLGLKVYISIPIVAIGHLMPMSYMGVARMISKK